MGMGDGYLGQEHRLPMAMDAAGDINVFTVHEEPFIEILFFVFRGCSESDAPEGFDAEQHETSHVEWLVHLELIAGVGEGVASHLPREPTARKEAAHKDIARGGQEPVSVLVTSVGIEYQVDDLSKLIRLLASDDAEYIYGDAILIDGGLVAGGGHNFKES